VAAFGQIVSIGTSATLLFEAVDGFTYKEKGYTRAANPTIFYTGTPNDPLPITIFFPASPGVYLGGSNVTNDGDTIGALVPASYVMTYNCIGGDSLYAVGADDASVQLLVMRATP
jgi:hypothetical protein